METQTQGHTRRITHGRWYNPVTVARGVWARPKLILAVLTATALLYLLPSGLPLSVRCAAAWNAGALVYLAMSFSIMATCGIGTIRRRAAEEDESRFVFTAVILIAIASSFVAVIGLIGDAKNAGGAFKAVYLSLAGGSVLTSWLVMQVVFTLHYAHDFYRPAYDDEGDAGGLAFPGENEPDYWDFFYFTTSIGATSQTSDVSIASRSIRRLVTLHCILSFVFNTTILALAINVAAGLIGGG
ncbi:MAG: DUF1345 domain-containing protein [Proteobacteria bacterium]|nr:DUF1345 domain-containing protein [Pseudomonadota bacterium]